MANSVSYDGLVWTYYSEYDAYITDQDPTRYISTNGDVIDIDTTEVIDSIDLEGSAVPTPQNTKSSSGGSFFDDLLKGLGSYVTNPDTIKGIGDKIIGINQGGGQEEPSHPQSHTNTPSTHKKSNTMTYVLVGAGVVLLGTTIYFATKK